MFAAPDAKDVEAQRAAQPAAAYPQQTDPMRTTVTVNTQQPSAPMQNSPMPMPQSSQQGYPMQSGYQMPSTQSVPPPGQNPAQNGGAGPSVHKSTIARVASSVHFGTLMLLLAFFSLVEMIAAAQVCDIGTPDNNNGVVTVNDNCSGTRGYQVSLGVISLVIAFIVGVMAHCGAVTQPAAQGIIAAFLFLWWVAGVIVCTFFGDFQTTERAAGYFATWFAFVTALVALAAASDTFEQGLDKTLHSVRKPLFFLFVASLVTMGASIGPCSPSSACTGYNAWAIVASVVSAVIALVLFCLPARVERKAMLGVAWFLVFWWVFAAATLTLGAPFTIAGNGFFGAYAALVSSAWFAIMLHKNTA